MGWRHRLLELLALGVRSSTGERLEPEVIVRLHDRIAEDPELSARLTSLEKDEFRAEFLVLYEAETDRDS